MNKYLDLNSLINSDFYLKNKRLNWHISQSEYHKFLNDIYDLIESIKLNKKEENEIFQLVKTSIFRTLSEYLSHVYDYVILSSNKINVIYSNKSKIYIDRIWLKKKISSIPSIEKNNKIYKKNIIKKIYQIFSEKFPKFFFNFIVMSKNPLINDFLSNKYKYLKLSHPIYLSSKRSESKISKILSEKISSLIINIIEQKYFFLEDYQKHSITFIIEKHLEEADNDLNNYNGFLKYSKNIILGTSGGHYTRLISTIAKNNSINVWKFDHGGEKCFFDDNYYWNKSFYNTDVFVTYGKKWKEYIEKKAQELKKQIKVKAIGSSHHREIFNKHFDKKLNSSKKILYIPGSFVSEERDFLYDKIIDPLLYDWQKYLIETLQNFKYEVIYKMHPKGISQENLNLGKIANHKTSVSLSSSFKYSDTVIVDYAGSALVEALCAGKDVIYIDMNQRPFNKKNFEDLNSVVKIVPANQKEGVFYVQKEELKIALTTPQKNIDKQRKLVREYWLESV